MPELGEIVNINTAWRLSSMPRVQSGKLDPSKKGPFKDAAIRSLLDITWSQDVGGCVNPIIRLHVDPQRLYCNFAVIQEESVKAAEWRNQRFDSTGFRNAVESAFDGALKAFEQGKYDRVFVATPDGLKIMDEKQAAGLKPRRL